MFKILAYEYGGCYWNVVALAGELGRSKPVILIFGILKSVKKWLSYRQKLIFSHWSTGIVEMICLKADISRICRAECSL
jgi:hypothetical protein